MRTGRRKSTIPLRFSDDFRGGILIGLATFATLTTLPLLPATTGDERLAVALLIIAGAFTLAYLAYLVWTHLVYSRTPTAALVRIIDQQGSVPRSRWGKLFGVGTSETWSAVAAVTAFIGALSASIYGASDNMVSLTVVALVMAATAWTTVVYTYALYYLRLHYSGEEFQFPFPAPSPSFTDFLTFSLMVSSAGSHAAGTPTTRTGVKVLRSHTVIAFVFNALVIAVTVSLITNVVTSHGGAGG